MPFVSQAQRAAFHAAAAGRGRLGIPAKVAKDFIEDDEGGKLPKRKKRKRQKTIMEKA